MPFDKHVFKREENKSEIQKRDLLKIIVPKFSKKNAQIRKDDFLSKIKPFQSIVFSIKFKFVNI